MDNGREGPARWSLRLFGGFQLGVLSDGEPVASLGKRERVLLAYLALSPNCRQQRRKLTTLLWGDAADETTLDNLRHCLWALRKALGDADHRVIASDGEDIVLDEAAFEVDVLTFRRLAAQSGRSELEAAAKLYAGDLLDGLDIQSEEFESWRRTEATRLKDQVIDVLNRLTAHVSDIGETDHSIETGLRLLALDPLHESTVRRLMRLYAGTDRRSTAIQLYRTLSDALRADLNAQPEAETRALFEEISRGGQADSSAVDARPPVVAIARPSDSSPRPRPTPIEQPASEQITTWHAKRGKLLWLVTGGLAAVIAIFLFQQFVPLTPAPIQQAGLDVARKEANSPSTAVSVAVLPFANMSGDPNQEFFSDGMTTEITLALAKIPDLQVVGRTSAFQYKGRNQDLRTIGQALNATHLIEGSVRKEGKHVRITAELVKAEDGTYLWGESFDRELTDIFAIQEEIAQDVAGSLGMQVGLVPGGQLVSQRAIDPESYEQYLRAEALRAGNNSTAAERIAVLEPVVARSPNYAPAWRSLALAYYGAFQAQRNRPEEFERARAIYEPKMDAAINRALELDPDSVEALLSRAWHQFEARNLVAAEGFYSRALTLDPSHPDSLNFYSGFLLFVGRVKEALPIMQRLREVEPTNAGTAGDYAQALWLDGQTDAAIAIFKDNLDRPGAAASRELARIYAALGRFTEAADVLNHFPQRGIRDVVPVAVPLLRSAPAKVSDPTKLPPLGTLGFIYLYVGAPERALDFYERAVRSFNDVSLLWHPSYAPVRKMERFKSVVREAGLDAYWRERGWPEFCHPIGDDDFECD